MIKQVAGMDMHDIIFWAHIPTARYFQSWQVSKHTSIQLFVSILNFTLSLLTLDTEILFIWSNLQPWLDLKKISFDFPEEIDIVGDCGKGQKQLHLRFSAW